MKKEPLVADLKQEFLTKPPRTLDTCRALVKAGYKPYAIKTVWGKEMEMISMPFPQDGIKDGGCGIGIMVREPGDPVTLKEWSIPVAYVRAALQRRSLK